MFIFFFCGRRCVVFCIYPLPEHVECVQAGMSAETGDDVKSGEASRAISTDQGKDHALVEELRALRQLEPAWGWKRMFQQLVALGREVSAAQVKGLLKANGLMVGIPAARAPPPSLWSCDACSRTFKQDWALKVHRERSHPFPKHASRTTTTKRGREGAAEQGVEEAVPAKRLRNSDQTRTSNSAPQPPVCNATPGPLDQSSTPPQPLGDSSGQLDRKVRSSRIDAALLLAVKRIKQDTPHYGVKRVHRALTLAGREKLTLATVKQVLKQLQLLHSSQDPPCQSQGPQSVDVDELVPATPNPDTDTTTIDSTNACRVRSVPHVAGNWATHVFLPVPLTADVLALVHSEYSRVTAERPHNQWHWTNGFAAAASSPPVVPSSTSCSVSTAHMSLSRTVYLRKHQLTAFEDHLRACLKPDYRDFPEISAFRVTLGRGSREGTEANSGRPCYMMNDSRTTTFACLPVTHRAKRVCELVARVDTVVSAFGQPVYWHGQATPHMSFAWTGTGTTARIEEPPDSSTAGSSADAVDLSCDRVVCTMGNRSFEIPLPSTIHHSPPPSSHPNHPHARSAPSNLTVMPIVPTSG